MRETDPLSEDFPQDDVGVCSVSVISCDDCGLYHAYIRVLPSGAGDRETHTTLQLSERPVLDLCALIIWCGCFSRRFCTLLLMCEMRDCTCRRPRRFRAVVHDRQVLPAVMCAVSHCGLIRPLFRNTHGSMQEQTPPSSWTRSAPRSK